MLGVGQTALAEDTNDAFFKMNEMLAQWSRKRWLCYRLQNTSKVSTGVQRYTVGSGADFDVPRADKLEYAFVRQLTNNNGNNVDYPLSLIFSKENYNQIALKTLGTFPQYAWYDPAFPLGHFFPWPIPQASLYELFITTKDVLTAFDSLTEEIQLPPEYIAALHYNLTVRLAPAYQIPLRPDVIALARDSLNVLRESNAQISTLNMPQELVRPGVYNPYSDQVR